MCFICVHDCVLWWTSAELLNFLCRILLDQESSLGLLFLIPVKLQSDIQEECSSCELLKTVHVSLISRWPSQLPVSSPAVDLPPQRWLLTRIVSPLTMGASPFSCIDSFLQHSRSLSLSLSSFHSRGIKPLSHTPWNSVSLFPAVDVFYLAGHVPWWGYIYPAPHQASTVASFKPRWTMVVFPFPLDAPQKPITRVNSVTFVSALPFLLCLHL